MRRRFHEDLEPALPQPEHQYLAAAVPDLGLSGLLEDEDGVEEDGCRGEEEHDVDKPDAVPVGGQRPSQKDAHRLDDEAEHEEKSDRLRLGFLLLSQLWRREFSDAVLHFRDHRGHAFSHRVDERHGEVDHEHADEKVAVAVRIQLADDAESSVDAGHEDDVGFEAVSEGVEGVRDPAENRLEGPGSRSQVVEAGVLDVGLFEVLLDVVEVGIVGQEQETRVERHHVVHELVISFDLFALVDFGLYLLLCHAFAERVFDVEIRL